MNKLQELKQICDKHRIAIVYLFGSQADKGEKLLRGEKVTPDDPLADLDVGVVFCEPLSREKPLHRLYARVYQDLEDILIFVRNILPFINSKNKLTSI